MPAAAALVALSHQRCAFHLNREAAVRCPSCSRFFCRECVTEHEGRFLCASCLRARAAAAGADPTAGRWRRRALVAGRRGAALGASFAFLWWAFELFGQMLARLPASFHEGALWGK